MGLAIPWPAMSGAEPTCQLDVLIKIRWARMAARAVCLLQIRLIVLHGIFARASMMTGQLFEFGTDNAKDIPWILQCQRLLSSKGSATCVIYKEMTDGS